MTWEQLAAKLDENNRTARDLSVYFHIPFCETLCWFCGCHTKQVLRYDPIAAYLLMVHKELETVGRALQGRGHVIALHLGGGSPSEALERQIATAYEQIKLFTVYSPASGIADVVAVKVGEFFSGVMGVSPQIRIVNNSTLKAVSRMVVSFVAG